MSIHSNLSWLLYPIIDDAYTIFAAKIGYIFETCKFFEKKINKIVFKHGIRYGAIGA